MKQDQELIELAASRGWRIVETRDGRIRWYRAYHRDGRITKCATQSVASTMRLIQVANLTARTVGATNLVRDYNPDVDRIVEP